MPAGAMDRHPAGGPIARAGPIVAGAPVGVIRPGAVGSSCSVSCAALYSQSLGIPTLLLV
jgi:hypothetical protein